VVQKNNRNLTELSKKKSWYSNYTLNEPQALFSTQFSLRINPRNLTFYDKTLSNHCLNVIHSIDDLIRFPVRYQGNIDHYRLDQAIILSKKSIPGILPGNH